MATRRQERDVTDLIDTTEMYLKTIYELDEEGITPLRARIAERLGHSGPTVSQTVARMERDDLVVVTGDRHLELTEAGWTKARRVMRKHRLAERLLTDVIKLDWEFVHVEACRWEHVMSELVERRLTELLDHPHHDPYGNPIPGLAELGEQFEDVEFLEGVSALTVRVAALKEGQEVVELTVERIAEPLQTDVELLARLAGAGIMPGARIVVERLGEELAVAQVGADDGGLVLPEDLARHVFVTEG